MNKSGDNSAAKVNVVDSRTAHLSSAERNEYTGGMEHVKHPVKRIIARILEKQNNGK